MTPRQLRRAGLNPLLGYKVSSGELNVCWLRHDPSAGGWVDLIADGPAVRSPARAVEFLSYCAKLYGGGEVIVFACACLKCASRPENIEAWSRHFQETGVPVSHGMWPECLPVELERLQNDRRVNRCG